MPTNSTSARSCSSPVPSTQHADHQDRGDRQQRDQRGVDGPDQGLVQRQVGGLAVGAPAGGEQARGVLPDLVEHHHGVVERVAEDREQADDRGRADLEAGQRVDPDRDHDVVHQRDERGDRPSSTRTRSTGRSRSRRGTRSAPRAPSARSASPSSRPTNVVLTALARRHVQVVASASWTSVCVPKVSCRSAPASSRCWPTPTCCTIGSSPPPASLTTVLDLAGGGAPAP